MSAQRATGALPRTIRAVGVLAGVALAMLGAASVAVAAPATPVATRQQVVCDQFGENCHPAPTPGIQPACSVSADTVAPGQVVTGHIENVPDHSDVTVSFDSTQVGHGTATAAQGQSTASADIRFTVPPDATPGAHQVVFSGAGFNCSTAVQVSAVLGEELSKGSSGPLARTGSEIAIALALALALVVAGAHAQYAARRRRREARARATTRHHDLVAK